MARPRANTVDTTNEYLGNANPVTIGEIGRGDVDEIETVVSMDAAAMEAFMNEILTVVVMSSADENDTDMVPVGVNGVMQYFKRDTYQDVKRKYVEVLARRKRTDFTQILDHTMGEKMNILSRRHALKYPFQVINDPNPKGHAWLKQILSEPV